LRYIYMNNFRGFSEALVPLKKINFLVGENSTGKSSFLSLLSLVNQPTFWFNPVFTMRDDLGPSSFADIVSAWSKDPSYFQVGIITTEKEETGGVRLAFTLHEFTDRDDNPKLSRHFKLNDKHLTTVIFEKTKTRYKVDLKESKYDTEEDALTDFRIMVGNLRDIPRNFKSFPKDIPPNAPLPMAVSILQSLESGDKNYKSEFKIEIPMGMHVTWIAPIRTKPKRIYDGISIGYSPEGEHAPLLLRKSLRSRTASKRFADKLHNFGNTSGLFETVVAHSFGKGAKDPFELIIKFKGAELNINNVGYGVSQALPLVVEFLTSEKQRVFSVQQPEVHLHPRAQAALGELVFELVKERNHSFFIETHSDYLIDRFRLSMRSDADAPPSQILFFNRTVDGNNVHPLSISSKGLYPVIQPNEFRDFFVKEEIKMLDI
jgi:predicted ATPase